MSEAARSLPEAKLDLEAVRRDFPILQEKIYGNRLVFLDSGASAQKPQVVLDAIRDAYTHSYANVHRGVYQLSQKATDLYEGARETVRAFLNAGSVEEIIFTGSATQSLNLVANAFGSMLERGDEVVISTMEHHSNIVPWQLLRERAGIVLKVAPIDDRGVLDLDALEALLGPRTKLVSITHVANALGSIVPLDKVVAMAKARGIPVMVDGSQAVQHMPVDVRALDVDFYVFTGHKVYGPSGIGILYGRKAMLEKMPPWLGGGDMILSVSFDETIYNDLPYKFEAGTPNIVGAIGLAAALDYVSGLGLDRIAAHEADVLAYAHQQLGQMNNLRLIGTAPDKAGVLSFLMDGAHPHDVGTILDRQGIAVRVGHHCAQPLMERLQIPGTVRASFGVYNGRDDVDALVAGLAKVSDIFG
ncbi:MAG: cysteine desulfurase [Sneathiellaceae bacterium]